MEQKPQNPLFKHFRQPAIYYKLPSEGRYWPDGSIEISVTGEIPIYPMTNADEITLKTPDALLNGTGIVNVIQSCCPNIKDAWSMPGIDVDALLIAIRIASYGNKMSVNGVCPHCNEEHDYDIDLSTAISQVKCPNYDIPVNYDGLKIKLRPQKYLSITQTSIVQFEEQKIAQTLADPAVSDDVRNARLKESMVKLLNLNEKILIDSIEYIETEDGTQVTDVGFIKEFLRNASGNFTKEIEKQLEKLSKEGALPSNQLKCGGCEKSYNVPIEFDYSRFFG
jgi:hypothetical protein